MKRFVVCKVEELPVGAKKIVDADGKSIGVFNVKGEYYAVRNLCPHQMAPLCLGKVTGYNEPSNVGEFRWSRQGEIVRCPWHGWEFDIKTGRSIFNPHKVRTKNYEVQVEHGCSAHSDESVDAEGVESYNVELEQDWIVLYA
jgi:nitrite reductase/ring-hydroxylating ferredoxin subunit